VVKRHLVTTSNEEAWLKDDPILFLGEWCKKYSRKAYWENLNSLTAPYHWDDREKLFEDYKYTQNLYEELLPSFSELLNKYNKENHDKEYWRVVAGPWLNSFISILFDRWSMIEYVLSNYELGSTSRLNINKKQMVPQNMTHFNSMYIDDDWNGFIFSEIIQFVGGINIIDIPVNANIHLKKDKVVTRKSFLRKVASRVKKWIGLFTEILSVNNDIFFISSYFSMFNQWKLQIKLGQFPTIINNASEETFDLLYEDRDNLVVEFDGVSKFEEFLIKMIPYQIPLVYVEGYEKTLELANKKNWPTNPRVILTAICYIYDDVFKIWAANKIKKGSKLFIEQHGGHFGTGKFAAYEDHQLKIGSFLSWGWDYDSLHKITPLPASKLINIQKRFKSLSYGGVLLVTTALPRYSNHLMSIPVGAAQYSEYEEDQMEVASLLEDNIRSQLTVRLFHQKFGCEQQERWNDRFNDIRIDSGKNSMGKAISKNRLIVSTQNSTTMLELLAANVPTVLFWNKKHWELNSFAQPYYDELCKVGILHDTPESAAEHINKVWHKVDNWWMQQSVQDVRVKFCNQYARTSDNWSDLWKEALEI
jgi:putative transferase (TIGR04331 family)